MGLNIIAPQGTYTAPAKLITKSITENGTYNATDDSANGYSSVTVEVEGGGGSSDFSTAEVTLNLTLADGTTISSERITDVYLNYPDEDFGYSANTLEATNHKDSVILYNNNAIIGGLSVINTEHNRYSVIEGTPTTTGGVTYNTDEGIFYVTGDGTITAELSAE